MIPVRLTVKNFMSYGEEAVELDFSGIHVASLSGDNGNGKSALLDAMTYALWGKTRASGSQASGEDDLVRLGAEDMEVQLEFRIGEDGYRVTRKRNRRTRSGDWQLHLRDESGDWRPSGGSSMSETGRHLARLLRMEYETFLNSAYIQQGRADEFTRQKPNDRKRILGDILDLSRYDRLEEMARERRGECDLALKDIEGEIRHLESRAAEATAAAARLRAAEEAERLALDERSAATAVVEELSGRLAELESRAARAREIQVRADDEARTLAEAESRVLAVREHLARAARLLSESDSVRAESVRLAENRRTMEELQPSVDRLNVALRERASLHAAVDIARQELLRELDRQAAALRRCEERRRQAGEIDARLADIAPKLAHFEKAAPERDAMRAEFERVAEQFTELASTSRRLKAEIGETEEVIALLGEPKPACPVCASDLSGGKQQAVLIKQRSRLDLLSGRLHEVNRGGARLKKRRDALQQQIETLEEQIRSEAALRAQRAELVATRERLCAENADYEQTAAQHEATRCRLEAGDFGREERAHLACVEVEIAGLSEVSRRHGLAAAAVRDLAGRSVEARLAELQQAEHAHATLEDDLRRAVAERSAREASLAALRTAAETAFAELGGLESTRESVRAAAAVLQRASAQVETALSQVARSRQTLEDCGRAAEMLAARQIERDRLAKDKQAYTELAAAFSKRGIQAHVIDNALPEVQEEANRLLSRLTDNAMQITLSTLRQARAGSSQIETLDISITDDAGTRPYEMFSGGEAFRVNFAIRIALSRLLARRAGANLQTLILDEGFGTQDAKGRERLVEAIEAVKDEFSLILVISHIEELKDAFPTRIEVTRTAAGSQVTFVE